jgi:thioredoxin reductase (NADPH)
MSNCHDLIIIGAGPAGLSAAYAAKRHQLDYLVLERGRIANTIYNYPLGKPLFSTPNELEFEEGKLRSSGNKPTREELLDYYHQFAEIDQRLNIRTGKEVEAILPGSPLTAVTKIDRYQARAVLVAVGGMGIPNKLGVPGETPERISYLFHDAKPFHNRQVLVVGGGNSAAEATLYLYEAGAGVTLLLRRPGMDSLPSSLGSSIKPWVRQPLEIAINAGKIKLFLSSTIIEIRPHSALVQSANKIHKIYCDHIFALIGARPDIKLLAEAGVAIGPDGRPEYDPETYETSINNLFVAGHLTRELHMKYAISIPPRIVDNIAASI